ncbi:19007_t:CDS:2, partial [Funneliformis geosporum]
MPSWVKYNENLTATEIYEERYVRPSSNEDDIYIGSPWETGKTYVLEHLTISDDVNLLVLSTRHSYSNAVTTRLNLKSYCDIDGNINLPDHKRIVCQIESLHLSIIAQAQSHLAGQSIEKLYKLVQDARRIIVMDNDLTDLNIKWIKALSPNKETVLAELWNWAKQMSLLPFESRKSVSLICHLRKDVQGIVRAFKTDFPELQIKEYHGKSDPVEKAHDFSNVEESWSNVDLVAYTKLQNRGIFPDIDSIIWNKDVPTVRLWVAYMLEKFRSWRLFGWRMVDFLREAGMIISTIESIPKPGENDTSLSQVVKVNSATVKAEEISEITNAIIFDHETAELLKNKPRKTLEEMNSLDQHHIVKCYQIPPELLTEDFISEYGNYNHIKWFRAYRQVRDAGTDNEMAVEAIT